MRERQKFKKKFNSLNLFGFKSPNLRRWSLSVLLVCFVFSLLLTWSVFRSLHANLQDQTIVVSSNQGALSVAIELKKQGLNVSPRLFAWLSRIMRVSTQLKAGSYILPESFSTYDLLNILSRGHANMHELRLVEGLNFLRFRELINQHFALKHDTAHLSDAELMIRLGLNGRYPEGLFFPDTYYFAKNTSDLVIYSMAQKRMSNLLQNIWQQRAQDLPLKSPYDALILASIIEKETGSAVDRSKIASVFINRLRLGMLLQTDPTVIYGLGKSFTGDITKYDLRRDTPYNTYTRQGLPPTPIAMPGRDALMAAVLPAKTNYLYFVAKGDGSSYFSKTLEEHNQAVYRYILQGRKGS